jgi:peptidoglycan/LPS O-acetylase OafA/YrhL
MPGDHRSSAQGLLALAIGTAIADYFILAAFHDITGGGTDPTNEYVFLALCGAWLLYVGARLIGIKRRLIGGLSLLALAAGLWGQQGIGPRTESSVQPAYVVTTCAFLWFVALAGILAVLSWRASREGPRAPAP